MPLEDFEKGFHLVNTSSESIKVVLKVGAAETNGSEPPTKRPKA